MPKKEVKVPKQKVPFSLGLPIEGKITRRKGTSPPIRKHDTLLKGITPGLGMEHPGLLKTPLSKPTLKSGEVRPPHKPGPPIPTWKGGAPKRVKPAPPKPRWIEPPTWQGKPVPPPPPKPVKPRIRIPPQVRPIKLKPAPGRSPTLKWHKKSR